jgi:hypothetical protein
MPSEPSSPSTPEPPSVGEGSDSVFCLSLRAAPEIGVVARMVQQLARLDLLPIRWHGTDAGPHLLVDIQLAGLTPREGELLAEALRRIVGVEEVLSARTLRRTAA